jgi:ubiquinone/menaquinone biosynthesis C-methylase UbiE
MSWDSAKTAERVARAYAAPDLAAVRERQVDLLDPQPGWRIADIGCGPGAFAAALCEREARVTAIDSARAMLDAVEARALGCELVEADALALPLADDSHDAACVVQVLEYVDDPVAALREAARIVRPGGLVLAADTDWDTQGFNVADRELGRRVVQAYADGKPDGWAGRRLRGWLAAAGLVPEARCAVVLDATEWGGDTFIAHNWPHIRRGLEKSGSVPAADLARFDAEIDESAANGAFYWSVVRHAWRARVPDRRRAIRRPAPRERTP